MNTNYVIPLSNVTQKNKTEIGVPPLELAELMTANVPIPNGFVITQQALEQFALVSQLDKKVKQLQQVGNFSEVNLTKLVLESELPREIYSELSQEFSNLSGISNIWLRIRAGLYDHTGNPLTFIDQKEISEVKGYEALELEVKKIWAKLLILDQKYDSLGSFIIVQKSVPAEVSGIIFTQDKLANNTDHILVKCMYGEYEPNISNFSDTYVFSKSQEKIIDRTIVPQEKMYIRSNKNDFGHDEVEISSKWQMKQKLSDKFIEDLSYLGDYLENVFTKPQEVSWIFQAGKIWINYVRPLTNQMNEVETQETISIEKDIDIIDTIVEKEAEEFEEESIDIHLPNLQKEDTLIDPINQNVLPSDLTLPTEIEESELQSKDSSFDLNINIGAVVKDVLLAGVGNNKGVIEGKIIFDREKLTNKDILVLTEWDEMPKNAAGIIIEDLIRISSELPIVYGAELALKILREGEYVRLDTDTGFIFELQTSIKESNELIITSIEEPLEVIENSHEGHNKQEENEDILSKDDIEIPTLNISPKLDNTLQEDTVGNILIEKTELVLHKTIIQEEITHQIGTEKIEILDLAKQPANENNKVDIKEEEIHTAIKVFANINTSIKEVRNTDGFLINLPHAEDYFIVKDKIDYKNIGNLIFTHVLSFLESSKKSVIYNAYDANPSIYIKNTELLDIQCEIVHKLRSKENMRQLYIALPKFKNLKQLREFRKCLSAAGLRRSTTFKVYIKVSYGSNVFELSKYLEDKFDGVIVSLETLYKNLYSTNKRLSAIPNTLVSALSQMQKECKAAKVPMILDFSGITIKKQMLQKLAPFINYGIVAETTETTTAKKYIANLEKERIFK